jgi:hypothetical protein
MSERRWLGKVLNMVATKNGDSRKPKLTIDPVTEQQKFVMLQLSN